MALISCGECGKPISASVKSCPQCGAKNRPPRKSRGALWLTGLGIVVVAGIVIGQFAPSVQSAAPPSAAQSEANAKRAVAVNLVLSAVQTLKRHMKDPDSFELKQALLMQDGSACLNYRARNSFNAAIQASAVFVPPPKGLFLTEDKDGDRFVTVWNARCTKKGGEDVTDTMKRNL